MSTSEVNPLEDTTNHAILRGAPRIVNYTHSAPPPRPIPPGAAGAYHLSPVYMARAKFRLSRGGGGPLARVAMFLLSTGTIIISTATVSV